MCAKAGKQLMYYKDWFDNKSRLAINDILIMSNFSYCTVMWIFPVNQSYQTRRYTTKNSEKADVPSVKIMFLWYFAMGVYRCISYINLDYLSCPYNFRDSSLLSWPVVKSTPHWPNLLWVIEPNMECSLIELQISNFLTGIQKHNQNLDWSKLQIYFMWHVYQI